MSDQPPSDKELDAIEARARTPEPFALNMTLPSCDHPERGHAPQCHNCRRADLEREIATRKPTFATHGRQDVLALVTEVRRLRALLEGRATTPTAAEADALEDEDGCWLVTLDWGDGGPPVLDLYGARDVHRYTERSEAKGDDLSCRVTTWRALDRDGRPCAWPTVTP